MSLDFLVRGEERVIIHVSDNWIMYSRTKHCCLTVLKFMYIYIYIHTHTHIYIYIYIYSYIGEGNGNPLQYSCLENPLDRGAWWAAVYGVAQSRT